MIEAIFASIGHIDDLDDLALQTVVEQVRLVQVIFEIGGTGKNDASHVDLVVRDVVLNSKFSNLTNVVMTLLLTQTRETERRLSTTSVFLWQIDREFLHHFPGIAAKCAEQGSVSIHNDEAKFLVGLKQLAQCLGMEFVVTKVERGVDRFEWLKINIDPPLFAFACDDFTAVHDETIWWDLGVELETLLGRGNG